MALDDTGPDFDVTTGAGSRRRVRVAFATRLTARAQVRTEVVRLHQEACEVLGVPTRR